jgi:hypothetical protein
MSFLSFDLALPLIRQTLVSSGLKPQSYTDPELEDMGMYVHDHSRHGDKRLTTLV